MPFSYSALQLLYKFHVRLHKSLLLIKTLSVGSLNLHSNLQTFAICLTEFFGQDSKQCFANPSVPIVSCDIHFLNLKHFSFMMQQDLAMTGDKSNHIILFIN